MLIVPPGAWSKIEIFARTHEVTLYIISTTQIVTQLLTIIPEAHSSKFYLAINRTLSSLELAPKVTWSIHPDLYDGDHYLILFVTNSFSSEIHKSPFVNSLAVNWAPFQELTADTSLLPNLSNIFHPSVALDAFTNHIILYPRNPFLGFQGSINLSSSMVVRGTLLSNQNSQKIIPNI